ncbi:signal peptidase II [Nocardioides sp.]|uniref:signal peptidase II n=1 Tax=Nocardioides sp. TaxID=35761 RepID=UPI0035158F99
MEDASTPPPPAPDDTVRGGAGRLAAPRVWRIFAVIAAVMLGVDQVTKALAEHHLEGRPDIQVIGTILQLHLTYNPGAAFSLGTGFTAGLSVLAIVATCVVLFISRRLVDRIWAVALGLLLAGITGNLVDRIFRDPAPFRGHVVDFLMLPNWPVFNIADVCINVGVALILLQVLRGIGMDGRRVSDAESAADDDAPAAPAAEEGR